MPKKMRVWLTAAQLAEPDRAQRAEVIARRLWLRLEMARWAARGHRVVDLAAGLGVHPQTVRPHVKAFLAGGGAASVDAPRSGRPAKLTGDVLTALEARLDADAASGARTWTLPQAAAWLAEEHEGTVNPGSPGEVLKRRDFRWKRTKRSSRRQQTDDDRQAREGADSALLHFGRRQPKRA